MRRSELGYHATQFHLKYRAYVGVAWSQRNDRVLFLYENDPTPLHTVGTTLLRQILRSQKQDIDSKVGGGGLIGLNLWAPVLKQESNHRNLTYTQKWEENGSRFESFFRLCLLDQNVHRSAVLLMRPTYQSPLPVMPIYSSTEHMGMGLRKRAKHAEGFVAIFIP